MKTIFSGNRKHLPFPKYVVARRDRQGGVTYVSHNTREERRRYSESWNPQAVVYAVNVYPKGWRRLNGIWMPPAALPTERSLAQQVGAMCANPVFWAFMGVTNEELCAVNVRIICEVESRSEIRRDTPAGDCWLELLRNFHGWEAAEKAGA